MPAMATQSPAAALAPSVTSTPSASSPTIKPGNVTNVPFNDVVKHGRSGKKKRQSQSQQSEAKVASTKPQADSSTNDKSDQQTVGVMDLDSTKEVSASASSSASPSVSSSEAEFTDTDTDRANNNNNSYSKKSFGSSGQVKSAHSTPSRHDNRRTSETSLGGRPASAFSRSHSHHPYNLGSAAGVSPQMSLPPPLLPQYHNHRGVQMASMNAKYWGAGKEISGTAPHSPLMAPVSHHDGVYMMAPAAATPYQSQQQHMSPYLGFTFAALQSPGPSNFQSAPTGSSRKDDHGLSAESGMLRLALPPLPRPDHKHRLEAVLKQHGAYETDVGMEQRREVIKELNVLVQQWIQSISLSKRIPWQDSEKATGRIVTFGSYFLGISHQGADIDALCIAPLHISREDYFQSFYKLLESRPEVAELRGLEHAFVPVIKMRYKNIEIDLTFARLNLTAAVAASTAAATTASSSPPSPPSTSGDGDEGAADAAVAAAESNESNSSSSDADFLISDKDLLTLDSSCIRSLNGYRSTLKLKTLVPNQEVFKLALRAVKQWAKAQGIYSNILGYLGGFSWAVLVAKACVANPRSTAVDVLQKFFRMFSEWEWPKPVTLVDLPNVSQANNPLPRQPYQGFQGGFHPGLGGSSYNLSYNSSAGSAAAGGHSSWNPDVNFAERFQVMPIITPTYPHLNSSFNVSNNTKKLIQQKMLVAAGTCDKIVEGKDSWDSLFKTCHMFHEYEHFLVVIASASRPLTWFGLIESQIRHLVTNIEKDFGQSLSSARIWPTPATGPTAADAKQLWFIGLGFWRPDQPVSSPVKMELNAAVQKFEGIIKSKAGRDANPDEMSLNGTFVMKSQLKSLLGEKTVNDIVTSQSYYNYHLAQAKRSQQQQQHQQLQQQMITPPTTPNRQKADGSSSGCKLSASSLAAYHHHHQQQLRYVSQGLTPQCQAAHSGVHLQDPSIIHRSYSIPTSYASVSKTENNNLVVTPYLTAAAAAAAYFHGSPVSSIKSSPGGGGLTRSPPGGSAIVERAWPSQQIDNGSSARKSSGGGVEKGGRKSNERKPSGRNSSPQQGINTKDQAGTDILGLIGNGDAKEGCQHHRYTNGFPPPPPSSDILTDRRSSRGKVVVPLLDPRTSSGSCSSSSNNPNDDFFNTSLESDHARSVSFSSDKFPPASLVRARIHHAAESHLPYSPGSGFPIPPPTINEMSPARPVKSVKSITRMSSGEICDVPTPAPVQAVQFSRLRFNFNQQRSAALADATGNDDVFL